jgi:hypothetical protein
MVLARGAVKTKKKEREREREREKRREKTTGKLSTKPNSVCTLYKTLIED